MVRLIPGDRVDCHLRNGCIINPHREFDDTKTFEIVAVTEYGYYLFVPQYICLPDTTPIDERSCKRMGIDRRFLGELMVHINENMVYRIVSQLDGKTCIICQEFCPMAEANQEDGTFTCFICRSSPYH